MATIKKLLERAKQAESSFDEDLKLAIDDSEQDIIDLNRKDQLFNEGIGSDGNIIGTYKKTYKPRKGQPSKGFPKVKGQPYNTYGYGDFFKGFGVKKLTNNKAKIFNTDFKTKFLNKLTNNRLLGLTDENERKANFEIIKQNLQKRIFERFRR